MTPILLRGVTLAGMTWIPQKQSASESDDCDPWLQS